MRTIIATLLVTAAAACATTAPKVTWRVANDCYAESRKEIHIVLPDGAIGLGITCTVVPHIVADTVKADTTAKKK